MAAQLKKLEYRGMKRVQYRYMTLSKEIEALCPRGKIPIVFAAMSKHFFCYRMFITKYVLEQGKIPISMFTLYDYFLLDTVDRQFMIESNNALVMRADELWVFGPISTGVQAEIDIAAEYKKPIRYYDVVRSNTIVEIAEDAIRYE